MEMTLEQALQAVLDEGGVIMPRKGKVNNEEFSQGEHEIMRKLYKGCEEGTEEDHKIAATVIRARLPYRTECLNVAHGEKPFVYRDIPEKEKAALLKVLFPFCDNIEMDDTVYDMHQDKEFKFGDAMIIYEPWNGYNYLVSPYYPVSGGMAVDFLSKKDIDGVDIKVVNGGDDKCTR